MDPCLEDVLEVLKLLAGVGDVGKRRCPDAGLACVRRSILARPTQSGCGRVTTSIYSYKMLADVQRQEL